ncbi:MAG: hypothetical protein L0H93_17045 [Nocardioides sp.]|nr:hypothetical protein [Nocardioides sp.]
MGKFILVIVLVTVAIYLITRLIETRGRLFSAPPSGRTPPTRPKRPRGPIGPDDDPEFLRDLNRRHRRDQGTDT